MSCKEVQDAACDIRIQPKTFQGGNDSVAAEHCAEPRYSRVGIVAFGVAYGHHFYVGLRARDPAIEFVAGTVNLATLATHLATFTLNRAPGSLVRLRLTVKVGAHLA